MAVLLRDEAGSRRVARGVSQYSAATSAASPVATPEIEAALGYS